ncbi:MAG TPA: phosphate/phosphite/phosphonate ABC transporter substrate-binding protein [Thermodesulfobacteriota bacterium]|nr:phosphate/phosphite/phosphonate ABC transporter substrate-binding protein [Thermodesulfobacteriota bacterium]
MKEPFKKVILSVVILFAFFSASPVYPQEKAATEKPTVYFGFISIYTPHIMYERFQPLMDYLSSNTPYRFRMRLTRDYNEMVNLLEDGSLKIALLGGASYVITRDKVDIIPILKPLNSDGKPFYRSIIVARKDRDINSLSDLKGKSFAFGARWSTSTTIDPLYYLCNNGIALSDFSSYVYLRYSDSVAREVLKGNFDAGTVIDTMAYFYKDKGLKFIFVSDPLPTLPVVVRKDVPKEVIASVKKALLSLDPKDPLNHGMLKEWGEEIKYGFVEAVGSDYDEIVRMIKYLKGKSVDLGTNED